jgi:hypothetical protein
MLARPSISLQGQTIVMMFNGQPAYDHFIGLAEELRAQTQSRIVFWPTAPSDMAFAPRIRQLGFDLVGPVAATAAGSTQSTRPPEVTGADDHDASTASVHSADGGAARILKRIPGVGALRAARQIFRLAANLKVLRTSMRQEIARLQPAAIITSQERPPGFITVLAEARAVGIPTFLLPPNYLCNPDGGAFMRRNDVRLLVDRAGPEIIRQEGLTVWLLNRLVALLFPHQVFLSRFGGMLCYPATDILGHWLAGLLPLNFWHQGTRFIDHVIVSGDEEVRVCREAGIPAGAIAKIGSPLFEELRKAAGNRDSLRQDLCRDFGLPTDRPITIFAIPVAWEHRMISQAEQFDFLRGIFPVLARSGASLLISLHPKSSRADYETFVSQFGAKIVNWPLFEILPAADVFIAGAYSSTVRWAMALDIPAVNMDVWGLHDSTYWELGGFPTFTSVPEFETWYAAVLRDPQTVPVISPGSFKLETAPGFTARLVHILEDRMTKGRA